MLGSGEERRSFVYVSDTVDAFVALGLSDGAPGRAFNIGGSATTRIIDLARTMTERYYGGEPEVYTTDESKPGDIEVLVSDNERIAELGVEPTVDLETGLDALYEWYHGERGEDA